MKVSEPKLKTPAKFFQTQVTCPDCGHSGFYIIRFCGRDRGEDDIKCHLCQAVMTIHWEK